MTAAEILLIYGLRGNSAEFKIEQIRDLEEAIPTMTKSANLLRSALLMMDAVAVRFRRSASTAVCVGALLTGISGLQSGEVDTLAREMLEAHNDVRAQMKLPALQWSGKLAAYSQQWANTLVARNRSGHNPDSPYGENIFINGAGTAPVTVVAEWAKESRDYTYSSNKCSGDCGHYTQLVWRATERVGCAVAHGARREVWVCSYDPPGNYEGEWPY